MARHLFFAITLLGVVGVLSPAKADMAAALCENQFTNCVGRCANPGSGVNNSKCMRYCDVQVTSCLTRAHNVTLQRRIGRWERMDGRGAGGIYRNSF
jgi:hypothetical protein